MIPVPDQDAQPYPMQMAAPLDLIQQQIHDLNLADEDL